MTHSAADAAATIRLLPAAVVHRGSAKKRPYQRSDHSPVGAPPGENWKSRYPLVLCLSADGVQWDRRLVLEDEPRPQGYAYPAVIQTSDGLVHVTYTWNRQRIKQVVIDPRRL